MVNSKSSICKERNCNGLAFKKGYCRRCYDKNRRNLKPQDEGYIKCVVEGCTEHACYLKKYCSRHYTQNRLYGNIFESRFDKNKVIYYEDYAEIILCDNKNIEIAKTKVSLHRVPFLLKYKWSLKDGIYARARDITRNENIVMQRLLMGVLDNDKVEVNYKNGDTLDNRDDNLRLLSHKECSRRSKIPVNNSSGYKGVSKYGKSGRWRAYISVDGKQIGLGVHDTKIEAIKARRTGEIEYFGFTVIPEEKI